MSETALLVAVRDNIRELCGYKESECEIEIEDMAPSTVGDVYLVVMPAGWRGGPGNVGGDVLDEYFDVDVLVSMRARTVPRDRQRGILLDNITGINQHVRTIITKVGQLCYRAMNDANELIVDSTHGFCEPLHFDNCGNPFAVDDQFFAAVPSRAGAPPCGIARKIHLRGARRVQPLVGAV